MPPMNYAQLVNKLYTFTNFVFYKAKAPLASAIISSNKVNTLLTATSIVNGTFIVICNIEYKDNIQKWILTSLITGLLIPYLL